MHPTPFQFSNLTPLKSSTYCPWDTQPVHHSGYTSIYHANLRIVELNNKHSFYFHTDGELLMGSINLTMFVTKQTRFKKPTI